MSYWSDKADNAAPIAPSVECPWNCAAENRVNCAVGVESCGPCLPGFIDLNGTCTGRLAMEGGGPLNDDRYEHGGISTGANEDGIEVLIELSEPSAVAQVEVYLGTVDENGNPDYGWANVGNTIWIADPSPGHSLMVFAQQSNELLTPVGLQEDDALRDSNGQKDHTLSYVFKLESPLTDVTGVQIMLSATDDNTTYGISLNEVRIFGTAAP